MTLNISIEHTNSSTAWVRVSGEVTIKTSPELKASMKPLFAAASKEVHVDLSQVPFMDSSGIATLVEGLQWARNHQGRFVLHQLQDTVRDIFALAKLDTVFDIEDAAEDVSS